MPECEVPRVGMNGVARIAVVQAQGISKLPLTAEDIAQNLDAIMGVRAADVSEVNSVAQEAATQTSSEEASRS